MILYTLIVSRSENLFSELFARGGRTESLMQLNETWKENKLQRSNKCAIKKRYERDTNYLMAQIRVRFSYCGRKKYRVRSIGHD